MNSRKGLVAGAMAASITLGAAFGAILFAPQIGSAQTSSTSAPAATETPDGARKGCHRGPHRPGLAAAAEAIGIEVSALREALAGGQSIAQVAEANDVAVQTVIDAMVAEAEEHLAQAVADGKLTQAEADAKQGDLEDRITEVVNHEGLPRGPRRARR